MDITRFIPFLNSSEKPVQSAFVFRLHEKQPKLVFALSILIALFGIFVLLAFPYLAITHLFSIYDSIMAASELRDWINVLLHLVIIGLSTAFTWAIIQLRFHVPSGIEINQEKFPHLHKFIEELREEFGKPKIDRVILRDKYEIKVVKTPRNRIPFMMTTTLIIGLPVLQTMSPLYFRALLARRIGQLSTTHTPVTTRLYFLTDIWQQFRLACKQSKNPFARVLYYFFQVYSPLYSKVSLPLLQEEELEADSYGMDLINDRDMVECLVYEEVVRQFLEKKFWPKIYHLARRNNKPIYTPYAQMTKVVKAGITDEEISTSVQGALKLDINHPGAEPSLRKRLNHLGHAKPLPPKRLSKTAADYYLGSSLGKIIQLFDKRWQAKVTAQLAS